MMNQLVKQAQAGDPHAQQELWKANSRWVAAIVLAHRPRTIDVDDLMQDVAVKLVSRIDTLREASAFRPWLRQIVINVCRGAARAQKQTLRLSDASDELNDAGIRNQVSVPESNSGLSTEDMARRDAAAHLLRQAMTLPDRVPRAIAPPLRAVAHLSADLRHPRPSHHDHRNAARTSSTHAPGRTRQEVGDEE